MSFQRIGLRAARSFAQQSQRRAASTVAKSTYKSPYGPSYSVAPNFKGYTVSDLIKVAYYSSGFAVAAGTFAIYFFSEIPRVRHDIMEKIPIIGGYWVREVAPEDNPF